MAVKFSQFVVETDKANVNYLVGWDGVENVQITPADLLSGTPSGSGAAGQVTFFSATSTVTGDNDFYWDNTNKRLGIGTTSPVTELQVDGTITADTHFTSSDSNVTISTSGTGGIVRLRPNGISSTTGQIVVLDSGNVGIGTPSPSAKLQVDGSLIATGISQLGSGGSNVYLTSSSAGSVGIGTSSPSYKLDIYGDAVGGVVRVKNVSNGRDTLRSENAAGTRTLNFGNDGSGHGLFIIRDSSGGVRNYITGSGDSYFNGGNVGIGTTSPSDTLTINNDNNLLLGLNAPAGNDAQLRFYSAGNYKSIIYRPASSNDLRVNTVTSGDVLTIQQGGNVGIGASSPSRTLHIGGPGGSSGGIMISPTSGDAEIQFQDSGTTNAYITLDDGTQDLNFRDDSATVMTIDFGGERVGIGTTSPTQTLDVDGAIITEDYRAASIFYLTSGDDWRFRSDTGSERVRITSGGNVGIGTTSPQAALHVAGAFDTTAPTGDGVLMGSYNSAYGAIQLNGTSGSFIDFSTSGTDHKGRILYNNSTNYLRFDTNGTEKVRILSNGNVGIGTTSASSKLHVTAGDAAQLYLSRTGSITGTYRLGVAGSANNFYITDIAQSADRLVINQTGNVGIGTSSPGVKLEINGGADAVARITGTTTAARFDYKTNSNHMFWQLIESDGRFRLYDQTNTSERLTITSAGNVGIGTTSPSAKLDVIGRIGLNDGNNNVSIGESTGDALTTGNANTAVGFNALSQETKGDRNVAVGMNALTGQNNTTNVDAYNVGVGYGAGSSITTGTANTLIGGLAGDALTTGFGNVAIGKSALSSEDTGGTNVAIGHAALQALDTGSNSYSVAIGYDAGKAITTGTLNTIVGGDAGKTITTGGSNVLMGYEAGKVLLDGGQNTLLGDQVAGALTSGDENTYIGRRAASSATTGNQNVAIGAGVSLSSATVSNEVNISNSSVIARFQGAASSWSFVSDARDKKDIEDLELGVEFINKLKPRKFKWDLRDSDVDKDKEASGFVAQEIQEILEETGVDYTGIVDTNNPDQYTVAQANIIPILVKAVQELSAEVKELKSKI